MTEKRALELEVICGTYEEFVVGYQLYYYAGNEVYQFEQTFADHSHTASVRCVACSGNLLASGGADELVKLYNMKRRTEAGQLMEHEGTVTCLCFHGGHHLFSGSEDGRVAVVRTDNWQREKYLGRHPGGVTALAVHPSGRLALTAGRDRKLLTWDLVRARTAFRVNLRAAAEFVLWSPGGSSYAVGVQGRCDVYSVASAGVIHSIKTDAKINCATYLSDSVLFVGDESGSGTLCDVTEGESGGRSLSWAAHQSRVRSVTCVRRSEQVAWLVTASSDGHIAVWETQVSEVDKEPRQLTDYNTTCRVLCLTVHLPPDKRWPPEKTGPEDQKLSTAHQMAALAKDLEDQSEPSERDADKPEKRKKKTKGKKLAAKKKRKTASVGDG